MDKRDDISESRYYTGFKFQIFLITTPRRALLDISSNFPLIYIDYIALTIVHCINGIDKFLKMEKFTSFFYRWINGSNKLYYVNHIDTPQYHDRHRSTK